MKNSQYNKKPLWQILNETNAAKTREQDIKSQEEFCEKLAKGDEKAAAIFEAQWDNAIKTNEKIDWLRARTPEEIKKDRDKNRKSVEKDRYQLEPERTEAQLIQDGKKRYYADYNPKILAWFE